MALCLFPDDGYEEVAEKLTGMLAYVPGSRWQSPTRGAITRARTWLGPEVMREVFAQAVRPTATAATPGAWPGRWRVMAIDGFVLDLPDTGSNVAEFGKDNAGGDETVFPQARVVALSECASHPIVAADVAGCWAGKQTLAAPKDQDPSSPVQHCIVLHTDSSLRSGHTRRQMCGRAGFALLPGNGSCSREQSVTTEVMAESLIGQSHPP